MFHLFLTLLTSTMLVGLKIKASDKIDRLPILYYTTNKQNSLKFSENFLTIFLKKFVMTRLLELELPQSGPGSGFLKPRESRVTQH